MFILNKKSVFQILLWLQTTFALVYIDSKMNFFERQDYSRVELIKTFGYDFYDITKLYGVLVWKISMGQKSFKPQDYSEGFTEFRSNETYLILAQNLHFTLYYWVGKETTLEHKKHVAKYAALFFMVQKLYRCFDSPKFNFAREDEMFESESFINTINHLKNTRKPKEDYPNVYRDEHFPLSDPNLYLMKMGQIRSSIKISVGLGLQFLTREVCVVVAVPSQIRKLHPASAYCSNGVNDEVRWRAQLMVGCIRQSFCVPKIIARGSDKYKALVELFEDKKYYRTSEAPYLQDGTKVINDQDEGTLLFKVSVVNVNEQRKTIREVIRTPITIRNIDCNSNYILDTKSVAGIFFAYADNDDINEVVLAVQNAEEYLHNETALRGRPIRMRTTRTCGTLLDYKMNFAPPPPPEGFSVLLRFMSDDHF